MPKLELYQNKLQEILKSIPPDKQGYISTSLIVAEIRKLNNCSLPTAYKLLWKNSAILTIRHGKVKLYLPKEPVGPEKEVLDWLAEKNKVLNKIVAFLDTQKSSAKKDDMLVKISVVREELKDGLDYGLDELFVRLGHQYKIKPEELV